MTRPTPTPEKAGRKQDGRFAPGASGNPRGKSKGSRHRVTQAVEMLLQGEAEALTRKAIEKALAGDITAMRLCLDRISPPRKDAPISMALPLVESAEDSLRASSAVLAAVASGEITPDEGGRIMALLTAHRAIVETADLARRLAALEDTAAKNG